MKPFYFGLGNRRLFGVYSPAHAPAPRNRAVVLCHPWGQEYLRAHRSMRQLASMLAAKGFHVLRFDYFGTGDSGGDMADADLSGWVSDVGTAVEEIRDMVGAGRIALVGLRLGAALASLAAARSPGVLESIVLWDPVVSGSEYLEELLATRTWSSEGDIRPVARSAASGGGFEILGFPMTAGMMGDVQSFELRPLVSKLPPRALAVVTNPLLSLDALQSRLGRVADPLTIESVPSLPAWLEDQDSGAGAVPVKVLQRIVQWLE